MTATDTGTVLITGPRDWAGPSHWSWQAGQNPSAPTCSWWEGPERH